MKQLCIVLFLSSALAGGMFAQSANWQVLESWGQLPAGTTWGGASQVSTSPINMVVKKIVKKS